MAAGVAMPEIKTAGPSVGLVDKKQVSFETNIRPEDKVRRHVDMPHPLACFTQSQRRQERMPQFPPGVERPHTAVVDGITCRTSAPGFWNT